MDKYTSGFIAGKKFAELEAQSKIDEKDELVRIQAKIDEIIDNIENLVQAFNKHRGK